MIIDAVELQRRYLKRIAGARDKKAYIGPEVIALDINNSCNLSCQFCWTHAPGNPAHFEKARFFSWEKFIEIASDAADLNVDQIHIVGTGEPTLHPSFRDMMRHLEQKPFTVKLFTNATFPLSHCSDVIKGDYVIINLSAADRQQYLDLKGKDLFDRVVGNIKQLVYLRDTFKPEFQIEIITIVNSVNIDQKQQMQDLATQLGVMIHFEKMNVHAYNGGIALPEGPMSDSDGETIRTPPVCLNGWFYMMIKPEDDGATTCCRIPQMHLGDFDKQSLKELWGSSKMMNIRLLGKYGHIQKMHKACKTCIFYDKNIDREQVLAGLKNEQAIA